MEYVDRLSRAFRPKQEIVTESVHTVSSVREDGSVNLQVGPSDQDIIDAIPALSSYTDRKAGDKVTVRKARRSWVVLGKAGALADPGEQVTMTSGEGAPSGSGWVQAQTVWSRGSELYIQRDTVSQPDPPPPPNVTVNPASEAAYAEGYLNHGKSPRQGTYSGYGPWSGIWCFGSAIADACAGRTVAAMTVRLHRTGSRHGLYSKQHPSIWTHEHNTPPGGTPNLHNRHDPAHGLGLGEAFDYPLPSLHVDALASGNETGIGVYTGEFRSDYIIYSQSGAVTIRFS